MEAIPEVLPNSDPILMCPTDLSYSYQPIITSPSTHCEPIEQSPHAIGYASPPPGSTNNGTTGLMPDISMVADMSCSQESIGSEESCSAITISNVTSGSGTHPDILHTARDKVWEC